MKLSISNIAWAPEHDACIYRKMKEWGYEGLEIAPTKLFGPDAYQKNTEAGKFAMHLRKEYDLQISSMQSIWYGRSERIFGSSAERKALLEYTRRAIAFAVDIGCKNLVFGCPKNRDIRQGEDLDAGIDFLAQLAEYADQNQVCIAMEANPPIYHTNFINDTASALRLIERISSPGFRLNLDVGTMIENQESIEALRGEVGLIHHVHISEPFLKYIEKREEHAMLLTLLKQEGYAGYISIEMGLIEEISAVYAAMEYLKELKAAASLS